MATDPLGEIRRRIHSNAAFRVRVARAPQEVLAAEGITDPATIQALKELAIKLAGPDIQFSIDQLRSTGQTADRFKEGLQDTLEQIKHGFQATMRMYSVAFYLGVLLVIAAGVMGVTGRSPLLAAIFGGLGIADFLGFFLANPPKDLQRSRADLAQLQAAYFTWFIDIGNWNGYLKHLSERDAVSFEEMKRVSDAVIGSTQATLEMVERYCGMTSEQPREDKPAIEP